MATKLGRGRRRRQFAADARSSSVRWSKEPRQSVDEPTRLKAGVRSTVPMWSFRQGRLNHLGRRRLTVTGRRRAGISLDTGEHNTVTATPYKHYHCCYYYYHKCILLDWRGGATGKAFGLAISRSRVQILLEAMLRNNLNQVVYTYVPLSPSSITWYRPKVGDALRLGK